MVRLLLCLFFLLAVSTVDAVDVTAHIDKNTAVAGSPLRVLIRIVRDQDDAVEGFRIDGEEKAVSFVNTTSHTSLSIVNGQHIAQAIQTDGYMFMMEGKSIGLYHLPHIEVKVNDKWYSVEQSTYKVVEPLESGEFSLRAVIEGDTPIYPGLQFDLVYYVTYRNEMEIVRQEMPLLEPTGLRKVREMEVDSYNRSGFRVQEIRQTVVADQAGTVELPPSLLEAVPYRVDFFGRKVFQRDTLRADAPAVFVTVSDFPGEGQPKSFNGALGKYSMEVTLKAPDEIRVGDKVVMNILIQGEGDLSTVRLPQMRRDSRFSQYFRFNDLPPVENIEGGQKRFQVELRPMTAAVKEIPSIEFSSLDPLSGEYHRTKSAPIPISVHEVQQREESVSAAIEIPSTEPIYRKDSSFPSVDEIEIGGLLPVRSPSFVLAAGQAVSGPLFPLFIVIFTLWVQWIVRYGTFFRQAALSSGDLLQKVEQEKNNPKAFYSFLHKTFILLLLEKGYIKNKEAVLSEVEGEELGELRALFMRITQQRYGGGSGLDTDEVFTEAKQIYHNIRKQR